MKYRLSTLLVAIMTLFSSAQAQDFFSTEDAPKFFTFGARLGFNTANRTFPAKSFNMWQDNSWGTGFDIGVVANLNFKDYLSIQPGLFYESRSGNFSYFTNYLDFFGEDQVHYELGHWRGYYFTIPVMAVVKFNLAQNIRWNVEFGPYLQFSLKQKGQDNVYIVTREPLSNQYVPYSASYHKFDFGLKMGTGLTFYQHYYVGIHYMAGLCNAWSLPSGGRNKAWMFTVGYDF